MNLIIDIGNTLTKLSVFDNSNDIVHQERYKNENYAFNQSIIDKYKISNCIICSVRNDKISLDQKLFKNLFILNHETSIPIINKYKQPECLGPDRLALAIASYHLFPNENCLTIDLGTCITYDLFTKEKEYLGGAISPGIAMRFKSLNEETDKLPFVQYNEKHFPPLIGDKTKKSIESGIINAIKFEMQGFIESFQKDFPSLRILLTGGDMNLFEKELKNHIFADANLLAKGLNYILNYNVNEK